ncbi:hypothetical protein UFOVP964_38 [uncultured Caudovirales phage]|uniref:Uncharacterized protein n=1 Tax=uncultured Caudovirales phage TaxID=2100421 RepID=A0A6J5QDT1_9CAUD|nr:hypothetical protein UFOVP854_38 [uncultured Caudovirales phage]CAB4174282.1 hypothetical protein UFOVP964_38 [uncultured Caudovirales phage]CAB4179478.1 hypothetical protein UFOVP1034_120 [uncultured Caudovirales phage]CAB4189164.1 hypothetical protein UFOVP1177_120 [uncultured Caudovirales phage]CAB4193576.1 hypothetical protein UFOVP1243_107 [uncultured Caudovirales phage]
MKIAIFSEDDLDVSRGLDMLITKYSEYSPEVIFPVKANQDRFTQSVIRKCLENSVKVSLYFSNAEGLEHLLKQTDEFMVCDDPVEEVLRQLSMNDAVGIAWVGSAEDHLILHTVEDLALDVWDISNGIEPIELDDDPFMGMGSDDLHDGLHKAVEVVVNLMAAYIASTVMESLGHAIAEHLDEQMDNRDISPFDDMD